MTVDRYTVNPGWALILNDAGINARNVLRRAELPVDLFNRPAMTLTSDQYYALWLAVEAEVGDPLVPLILGRTISLESFDPAIFAATCSPNLDTAARRIAQHKRLIGPLRLDVVSDERGTELEVRWPLDHPPPQVVATTELVFWATLPRLATRHNICPVRVTSPSPPPDTDAYSDYFGVPIVRDARYSILFSPQDAARRFLTANDRMWEFFEPELRRRLEQLDREAAVRERVRVVLLEQLPAGRGSVRSVAAELAMSTRTLQRRLEEEQTSFQDVLAETRERLARHYVTKSDLPASEIAFLLGYEDPRSFYRAFQTWTGSTPRLVRARAE